MGEVVNLDTPYFGDLPPETITQAATKIEFSSVLVIGHLPDGGLYFATSCGSIADSLLLIKRAEKTVLDAIDDA